MDEKILIPIIISIITTLLTLFFKSIFDKNIENYRNRQNHSNESVKALRNAISSIQSVKDKLQLVLDAYKDGITSDDVNTEYMKSLEIIVKAYQEYGSFLSKEESTTFHNSKNFCVRFEHTINDMLKNITYPSEIDESNKVIVKNAHIKLTEYQNLLRDFRDERVN